MKKFLLKCRSPVLLLLLLTCCFFLNPTSVEAASKKPVMTDMELGEGGVIRWESESSHSTLTGWRYYVKYWNFTITKKEEGKKPVTITVKVYKTGTTDDDGKKVVLGYTDQEGTPYYTGGRERTPHYYSVPVETLEKLSGWDLTDGNEIFYQANAAIGFRYREADGDWSKTKVNNKTYTTEDDFYAQCKKYGMSNPDENYRGYYEKDIKDKYFYIEVVGDEGFESVSGSGWYKENSTFTATGKTKTGYTSNGDIPVKANKNKKVTLTSTRWTHEVIYDSAGGTPVPAGFTKIYGVPANITQTIPSLAGKHFTEWKSKINNKTYAPGADYVYSRNGGKDTLVAQYEWNKCTFIFDANGGTGTMTPVTAAYNKTFTFPECGFESDKKFMGWLVKETGQIVKNVPVTTDVKVLVNATGQQYKQMAKITLVAMWDGMPVITAKDRYFTYKQALNGEITQAELFLHASAEDEEDGTIKQGESFYLKGGYKASKYKNLTLEAGESTVIEETYIAVDSAGNRAEATVKIHIVNTDPVLSDEAANMYVRFISLKYLDKSPEEGGLEADSIWREPENYARLKRVLSIKRINPEVRTVSFLGFTYSKEIPGTGEWYDPTTGKTGNEVIQQEWYFTKEDIKAVKEYVNEHGMGNSKEPDALKNFLKEFAHCITYTNPDFED